VDSAGTPLQLRAAELTSQGFAIAGADWEIAGQGPINSASQNVAPGQRMTITGSGLQRLTTTGIYILSEPVWVGAGIVGYDGTFTATFTIPQLTSGNHTLQINMVRQGQLPVSVALGMNLTSAGAGPSKAPLSATNLDTAAQAAAQLVSFAKGSAKLSTSAQAKLRKFAASAQAASSTVAVTGFSSRGTVTTSPALAQRRAKAVSQFLTAQGVSSTPAVTQGESSVQGRSVLLVARPASIGASQATTTVSSLIVQYKKGVTPRSKVPITGTERVTGVRRSTLTLGNYLGFRMYQVNFAAPVAVSVAEKVAAQMSKSRSVVFAEPDTLVSISTSTN
ncbi:MAG: OmpA family protein, partial [Candidatus Nanopelagicales bacterium]|nr:OmpA family protein [Candidatus Nanopelagicales bacterium]